MSGSITGATLHQSTVGAIYCAKIYVPRPPILIDGSGQRGDDGGETVGQVGCPRHS
jgi:hypothetical protein